METLCSIGHARGFLEVGEEEEDGGRRAPIPARERSLRAATSHSRLPGDRGATDTRLGARGAGDQTLLYRLAKSTRVHRAVAAHAGPQVHNNGVLSQYFITSTNTSIPR